MTLFGIDNNYKATAISSNNEKNKEEGTYKVQSKDTLKTLALKFNMSESDFKAYIGQESIKHGQLIKVPTYKIEASDSFIKIAKKFNMTPQALSAINPQIKNSSSLQIGAIINVPFKSDLKEVNQSPAVSDTTNQSTEAASKTKPGINPNQIIKIEKGNMTASEMLEKANVRAKATGRGERPFPVFNQEGELQAEIKTYEPTSNAGPLKGKTIIVNSGHGGYYPFNGAFDSGTASKDENGNVIEEWTRNALFAKELTKKLNDNGARVVYMSGSAATVKEAKAKYKNADLFISIHCDHFKNQSRRGQTILYKMNDSKDYKLAKLIEKNLEQHGEINEQDCRSRGDDRSLAVLESVPNMPSVLVETGFQSNKEDLKNINSEQFRDGFVKHLSDAIIEYF